MAAKLYFVTKCKKPTERLYGMYVELQSKLSGISLTTNLIQSEVAAKHPNCQTFWNF